MGFGSKQKVCTWRHRVNGRLRFFATFCSSEIVPSRTKDEDEDEDEEDLGLESESEQKVAKASKEPCKRVVRRGCLFDDGLLLVPPRPRPSFSSSFLKRDRS